MPEIDVRYIAQTAIVQHRVQRFLFAQTSDDNIPSLIYQAFPVIGQFRREFFLADLAMSYFRRVILRVRL